MIPRLNFSLARDSDRTADGWSFLATIALARSLSGIDSAKASNITAFPEGV
jgi:hypothetical protein